MTEKMAARDPILDHAEAVELVRRIKRGEKTLAQIFRDYHVAPQGARQRSEQYERDTTTAWLTRHTTDDAAADEKEMAVLLSISMLCMRSMLSIPELERKMRRRRPKSC